MGKITEGIPMNITVYLGANEGSDPAMKEAVEELGRWIGESGNALVYGGSGPPSWQDWKRSPASLSRSTTSAPPCWLW